MEEKMRALVDRLNAAADAYYNGRELISDYEYDKLYDSLVQLETESGIVLPDSPTQRAGFEVVDTLPRVVHSQPALSLDKTKDISEFPGIFAVRDRKAIVMWKMDGSTVIVTYEGGKLVRAATRGDGSIGSDITHNAPFLRGLPISIPFEGRLVVRGEAVMSYEEFARINAELPLEAQYKNPRNLANASISLLDSREMRQREIWFHAFKIVDMDMDLFYYRSDFAHDFDILAELGIHTVEYSLTSVDGGAELPDLLQTMREYSARAEAYPFPVDGLVVAANDTAYAEAQPGTAHNPNKLVGYALKWQDETAPTTLRDIIWQASRTGLINPVAVFDPVELEGTTVTRATLHNVSYLADMDLKIGDRIGVYKANKIIPKVGENYSQERSDGQLGEDAWERYHIPRICPVCGSQIEMADETGSGSVTAVCRNADCPAKKIGSFVHFCSRSCMNILRISAATVEKLVDSGFVKEFADFWKLERYHEQIVSMEGFGEKAFARLSEELEKARKTTFVQLVTALGIPNVGAGQARILFQYYQNSLPAGEDMVSGFLNQCRDPEQSFGVIDGFGEALDQELHTWGQKEGSDDEALQRLLAELEITDRFALGSTEVPVSSIAGKTFVITGELIHFSDREALKKRLLAYGAKVTGSVSRKTAYLINNDITSTSTKNQKAKQLQIPIISEQDLLALEPGLTQ